MPNDVDSTRDAISEAWTRLEAPPEAPAAAPDAPAVPVEAAPAPKAETPSEGPVRDEQGRFTKAEGKPAAASNGTPPARASDAGAQEAAASGAPGGPPAAMAAPPAAPASVPGLKAPQSWKPALREKWGALPGEVQAEVDRREKEIAKALQESAEAQKGAGTWTETVRPYEAQIRATGANPQQYVGNLLQAAHGLFYGPPHLKPGMLADLILQAGVNPQQLDDALVARMNGQPAQQAPRPQDFRDPRVDQIIQAQQAQENARLENQIGKFIETHEYANHAGVYENMATVIEAWKAQGKDYNSEQALEKAYGVACNMDEDVRTIISRKEAAEAAKNAQASTQRARVASSSVKSQPGGPPAPTPPGDDTRSHIEASWDRLAGQQ